MVGEVVLTPFPFTDLQGAKMRPALVLADAGMGDWVLCEITSRRQRRAGDIALARSDMQKGRLRRDSWVRPSRLQTLEQALFSHTLGQVSNAKLAEVAAAVRALF